MGIATQVLNNSQGVTNRSFLAFTTDAVAAADTVFNFGFKPRYIRFYNLTDRLINEFFEGTAAGTTLQSVAAGTTTLDATSLITVGTDNTVTVKASLMVASKSFVMMAEG